ncbi:hypothetical protein GGR56DRAFT_669260 [Xylariaceae sp. FL0804]|nr:hypothetical protein GGR56DRAFT_669260 [Xylariaceae sp. FL0804]
MESLPPEVLHLIASHLEPPDLRSLRLTSRRLAAAAAPSLFRVLRFAGSKKASPTNDVPGAVVLDPWRTWTVEFGQLEAAVEKVLPLPLAEYAKTLIFDPAYYREGFWQDYRRLIAADAEMPADEADIDYDEDDEDDEESGSEGESYQRMMERANERRRTRPERELPVINEAERHWAGKVAEQEQNEAAVVSALTRLFRTMKQLTRIDVRPYEFSHYEGLGPFQSWDIDLLSPSASPTVYFLSVLSRALHAARHSVRSLRITELAPALLRATPATRFVFTGLQALTLCAYYVDFLLEAAPRSAALVELLACARPTLRRLDIRGGYRWPHMPAHGPHSLLRVLSSDGEGETPLVFPQLTALCVASLTLSTEPLVRFLAAQPALESLEFRYLYLSTRGKGWPYLAGALPPTVKRWIGHGELGHEPYPDAEILASDWMQKWSRRGDPAPSLPGWEVVTRKPVDFYAPLDREFIRI